MTNSIKIYVADLAAYNNGDLHGVWIDATASLEDIQEKIAAMLAASPVPGAEEYEIHAHEGFGDYEVSESIGIEEVHEIACFIEEYPEFGSQLLAHCGDLETAQETAKNNYCGCYASLADYAQELTEETTTIPDNLRHYIDYEAMARDMEINGEVITIETGWRQVHIFWPY